MLDLPGEAPFSLLSILLHFGHLGPEHTVLLSESVYVSSELCCQGLVLCPEQLEDLVFKLLQRGVVCGIRPPGLCLLSELCEFQLKQGQTVFHLVGRVGGCRRSRDGQGVRVLHQDFIILTVRGDTVRGDTHPLGVHRSFKQREGLFKGHQVGFS